MRAAIYARVATEAERERLQSQFLQCETLAAQNGCKVVSKHFDVGQSGANGGVRALLQLAADANFEVVLTMELHRLSRDRDELVRICRDLHAHGVRIITAKEGEIPTEWIVLNATALELSQD